MLPYIPAPWIRHGKTELESTILEGEMPLLLNSPEIIILKPSICENGKPSFSLSLLENPQNINDNRH